MKVLAILVFVAVIALAASDDKPGCTIEGKAVAVGQTYQPKGKCTLATCGQNNQATWKACPSSAVTNPKEYEVVPEDPTKPYPSCCSSWKKKN